METKDRENSLRVTVFSLLLSITAWVVAFNCYTKWIDGTLLIYYLLIALCCGVVVLSLIWWWRTTRPATVFYFLLLLAAGLGIDACVQAHGRTLRLAPDIEAFQSFGESMVLQFRQVGEIVALIYLLAVIVSRMHDKRGHYVP
jgi:hypothetical protein